MARKTKETNLEASPEANPAASNQANDLTRENAIYTDDDSDVYHRSRCGGALRTARESQNLSIQDIASRLRLGPKQIEALETDNFAALPEPTIVRGFIRNYAKQLKINAEPLLDAYNVLVPNSDLHRLIVKPSANMKMTSHNKPKSGRYLWLGLLILLGLGAWLFYHNYVAKPSSTSLSEAVVGENASNESTINAESLPEAALPAAEREASLQTSTELTLPAAPEAAAPLNPAEANAGNGAATTATLPGAISLPAPVESIAPIAAVPPVVPASPALLPPASPNPNGSAKLEFNATQETWIQVLDASGRQIYNKIIFAGSRESIDVTPPVNVTVGNAGATSLSMNGKPVELAPHSRQNVARIKLE